MTQAKCLSSQNFPAYLFRVHEA